MARVATRVDIRELALDTVLVRMGVGVEGRIERRIGRPAAWRGHGGVIVALPSGQAEPGRGSVIGQ
jgi:hypothetical protein